MEEMRTLSGLLGLPVNILSKEELIILEIELFTLACEELEEIIKFENKDYFRLLKLNKNKEKSMIESSFIRCIIQDIVATESYTLTGIAYYTDTPEDIINEVASGLISNPTFQLSQKIINLHRSVRPELYRAILNKVQKNNFSKTLQ